MLHLRVTVNEFSGVIMARLTDDSKRKRSAPLPKRVICQACTRPFDAERSDAKYCSDKCRQRAKRARDRADRWSRCPVCGEYFHNPTWRKKHCSPKCKQAAYRDRIWQAAWGGTLPEYKCDTQG